MTVRHAQGAPEAGSGGTRALVIVNPLSGRGRRARQLTTDRQLAHVVLARHGWTADVRATTGPGDAHRLAREAVADGCALVVAWGGDGTVNEVASALVHTGIPLAIVPAGSGNGLAGDLALPFEAGRALTIAATGVDLVIDAGRLHDALFFNIAGIGIDALIAERFSQRGLRRRGRVAYLQLGMAELMRYRAETYVVSVDGKASHRTAMLVALANGRQYGNNVCIAPGARLDDGLLEMIVVDRLRLVEIAVRLPALFRGTLTPGRGITMQAVREARVAGPGPLPFHVDGEPHLGPSELVATVVPQALRVRVPAR